MKPIMAVLAAIAVCVAGVVFFLMPQDRKHTVVQKAPELKLVAATEVAGAECKVSMSIDEGFRILTSNGVPRHKVGVFPNPDNPNAIAEQNHVVNLPVNPQKASFPTHVKITGYTVEGVPFKPNVEEFYLGNRALGWRYEVLSGAIAMGMDANHAIVQPGGAYHYYGPPTLLLDKMGISPQAHSPQIGWATDGFPIYAYYGFSKTDDTDSEIVKVSSGYQLKTGKRPTGQNQPGGVYDGTFTADWKYVAGSGDLDSCNGRFTVTPEFPGGTYAYFLTDSFPVIPRCLWGQVN